MYNFLYLPLYNIKKEETEDSNPNLTLLGPFRKVQNPGQYWSCSLKVQDSGKLLVVCFKEQDLGQPLVVCPKVQNPWQRTRELNLVDCWNSSPGKLVLAVDTALKQCMHLKYNMHLQLTW